MGKKIKIKTKNINPNFTIVLPGTCQAKYGFCFLKEDKNTSMFLKMLKKSLKKLPDLFNQISISGGEPTLSPVFDEALDIIRKYKQKGKIKKVVLTTNGIHLIKKNLEGIDHINISRYHFNDEINSKIFGTNKIPNTKEIQSINDYCNKNIIDINYNVVLIPDLNTSMNLKQYIFWAKATYASSITFRNQYGEYGISSIESKLITDGYKPVSESLCPVCRTTTYLVSGMKVRFHSSDYEPTESKEFDKNEVYEVILQPNGNLTRDLKGEKILLNKDNF
jgi:pyruvate-formate lyase-activating enzyme